MINQKFQAYYAPAIATKSLWRLFFGLIVIVAVYMIFMMIIIAAIIAMLNSADAESIEARLGKFAMGTEPRNVIIILLSFIGMFLGVLLAAKLVHKRGLQSLLGPNLSDAAIGFRNGFLFLLAISFIGFVVFSFIDPPLKNMAFPVWIKWMLIGIPLLFIQILSEELVFRGYFQQQLAARFNSRWAWYFLPSVAFGLLHYDPENMGSNAWLVVAHTTLFGLIAAEVTARTGNLGTAIGLHFANNIFALTIVVLDGPLSGLGLYKTAVHVSDETAIRSFLMYDFIFMFLLYGLFLLWCKKRPQL
jgi:membrane protease YdiL (CAAX protease family)